ncbi:hypothetical protein B0H19DRAFT_1333610 [Mycena capillaripes]|nr:hypothetical protein B0H19DRAFT_1333610 [Mycena capillaripes]
MTLLTSTTLARNASASETIALPFIRADPSEELPERSIPPRHLETTTDKFQVNYLTIEKSLRIPQAKSKSKSIAQDLSMLPKMQLNIVLEDCGRPNTGPDYVLWRRVCTPCMDKKYLHGGDSEADAETMDADRNGYAIAALYEAPNSRGGYPRITDRGGIRKPKAFVVVTISARVRIDVKPGLGAFSSILELNILQTLKRSQPGWPAGSSFSDLGADTPSA